MDDAHFKYFVSNIELNKLKTIAIKQRMDLNLKQLDQQEKDDEIRSLTKRKLQQEIEQM